MRSNKGNFWILGSVLALSFLVSGCAPLLVAGGAVGGYAAAKDMEDGKLIDSKTKGEKI